MESMKDKLVGIVTKSGWQFIERMIPGEHHTGGSFSTGYIVKRGSEFAFAKALDLAEAFSDDGNDIISALKLRVDIIEFERFLLQKCRDSHLSNVVKLLECESIQFDNYKDTVFYFIFEKAAGDIRNYISESDTSQIDSIFKLIILHDVATGINQLHQIGIAHQDLKPSNVLVYGNKEKVKITDLGRSSSKDKPFIYDNMPVPGDRTYAPLDLLFGYKWGSDFSVKYAMDLYGLGSLMLFLFCGYHMTPRILQVAGIFSFEDLYSQVKPVIQNALVKITEEFRIALVDSGFHGDNIIKMTEMLKYLCSADPEKRGEYHTVTKHSFGLQRYITEFDLLIRRAQQRQL